MASRPKVINRLPEFINSVERKAARAVTMSLIRGASEIPALTPQDTSTLINSQFRMTQKIGTRIVGTVGFTAEYAKWVHRASGKLKGQPRPKRNGKDQGYYWGPHDGQPQFLTKAFERASGDITEILRRALRVSGGRAR